MSLTGATVLVVEDNPDHRIITMAMLGNLGAQVILARDGQEGLHALDRARPDLILCDLRMPVMDGFEFARRVRNHPKHGRTPLIALTALDTRESYLRTWGLGFDAHLIKPVTFETLDALDRYLMPHPKPLGHPRAPRHRPPN
jgi:CheY-like chemotaxis protein